MTATTATATPQPKTLKQKLIEQSAGIRQLERLRDGLEVDNGRRLISRLAKIHQNAYAQRVGVPMPDDSSDDGEDEGDIHIGDTIVHRVDPPPTQSPPATQGQPSNDGWWQIVAVAALSAATALIGGAVYQRVTQPQVPAATGGDADTQYNLDGDWTPVETPRGE